MRFIMMTVKHGCDKADAEPGPATAKQAAGRPVSFP